MSDFNDEFEALVSAIGIDADMAEKIAEMEKQAEMHEKIAAAIRADIAAMQKAPEDRDCKIVPAHFHRDGDLVRFTAPTSEREKMAAMLPGMAAACDVANKTLADMRRAFEDPRLVQMAEMVGQDVSELREQLADAEAEMLACIPDAATLEVIQTSLFADVLTIAEAKSWQTVFSKLAAGADEDTPDHAELNALAAHLAQLTS